MQSPNNKPQYASSGKPMNQRMPNMGRPPAIMSSSVSPSEYYITWIYFLKLNY